MTLRKIKEYNEMNEKKNKQQTSKYEKIWI